MKKTISDLPNWVFNLHEISANAYKVIGQHKLGSVIELTGMNPDRLMDYAISSAKTMELSIQVKVSEKK